MAIPSPTQAAALKAMLTGPLIYSVAGWHLAEDCLHNFHTQTIEALSRNEWCRVGGCGRRLKATITLKGRGEVRKLAEAEAVP